MSTKTLSHQTLREWVGSSSFVFQGKVKAVGDSNLHGVKPNERMALVNINKVVIAPRMLGDITGDTITVYLQSNNELKKDQQITLFATNWHYGENIGVIEIGRTDLSAKEIGQDTIDEKLRQLDEKLEERIKRAKLIVSGSVISTYSDEKDKNRSAIEEEVNWHKANIRIDTVEKGHPPDDLHILFPKEGGKEFMRFPTYNEGQKGVWLLHPSIKEDEQEQKKQMENSQDNEQEQLTAPEPLDYHALSALPRIQALLWRLSNQ